MPYSVLPQQDTSILDPTLVRAAYRDLDGVDPNTWFGKLVAVRLGVAIDDAGTLLARVIGDPPTPG